VNFRALDLFSGAGGLSQGLVDAGFEIVAAVENWEPAVLSYQANFPNHVTLRRDIGQLATEGFDELKSFGALDLLVGGPPCQGFSIQRIGHDQDDRNDLIIGFARAVAELKPRMFLMENVPGLLGHRGKKIASEFVRQVTAAGYDVDCKILDAASYGVPQIRRRVFFVGWIRGDRSGFAFPKARLTEGNYQTVREAIGDLPSPPNDYSSANQDALHRRMRLSAKNLERLRHIPPGGGFESLPVELRVNCHKAGASRIGHRSVYGRLHPDRPANTITARFDSFTRGRFAHPWEDRNISLREGARLQSFSDDFVFNGTQEEVAAQIGNAVPPALARHMAEAIRKSLISEFHRTEVVQQGMLDLESATAAA